MSSLKRCVVIFPTKSCSKDKEMSQSSVMHVQSCCLRIKPIAFLMLTVLLPSSSPYRYACYTLQWQNLTLRVSFSPVSSSSQNNTEPSCPTEANSFAV